MKPTIRIDVIDALRGFALIGILYVHVPGIFLSGPPSEAIRNLAFISTSDHLISSSVYWFALSKFFSIFSMLFGFGFYIQMKSGHTKFSHFEGIFAWRMLLLMGFGLFHWLFYAGDVLVMYGMIGLLLIPFAKLNNTTLLIIAFSILVGLPRAIIFAIWGNEPNTSIAEQTIYNHHMDMVLDGGFWQTALATLSRFPYVFVESLGIWGRFYLTFAYFLIGIVVARLDLLSDIAKHLKFIYRVFALAGLVSLCTFALHLNYIGNSWAIFMHDYGSWNQLLYFTIYDLHSFAMSLLYASGFIILCHFLSSSLLFKLLAAYGRTALTSFIFQSVIGTFLLHNWGIGLLHQFSTTGYMLVFVTILAIQITFSYYWLRVYKYGPLEWVWRSLTYRQWIKNDLISMNSHKDKIKTI